METVDELCALLAAERMERKRIYVTARLIGMLRWRGVMIYATIEEWQQIIAARDAARAGDGERILKFLPRGYEIARWYMIIRAIRPYEDLDITEDDLIAMSEAFFEFHAYGNFLHQASLFQTCSFIGVEPILPEYSLLDLCFLGDSLHNLQQDIV